MTQEFENPYAGKIEAVYTFPLPHNAAVDDMTMLIGDRIVRGNIKRREEARPSTKRRAIKAGSPACSIRSAPTSSPSRSPTSQPGEKVKITISYVETLEVRSRRLRFRLPMVVAPRYIPAKRLPDRPNASTPPVTPPGTRAGHDISVEGDARCRRADRRPAIAPRTMSPSHRPDARARPRCICKDKAVIPNKDFVLQYDVAGQAHRRRRARASRLARGGFFTLILQPPDRVTQAEIAPKELVFVLDTSGSMSGFPIEKAKETMKLALDGLNPRDTFNLITFSGDTHILFPAPGAGDAGKPPHRRSSSCASRSGSGGTEMMKAIRAALDAVRISRTTCASSAS